MRLLHVLALALAGLAPRAAAQELVLEDNPIPDLFASLVALTLTEEISGGSFRIDNGGPAGARTRFETFRVPWRRDLDLGGREDALRVEASLGVLRAHDSLRIDTASGLSVVKTEWLALGGQAGIAWNEPLGGGWRLSPGVGLALARLSNSSDLNDVADVDLSPAYGGKLFDWNAWAAIATASLTVERPRPRGRLATGAMARYARSATDVFHTTDDVQRGDDTSAIAIVRAEVGGPTPLEWSGAPVAWDVSVGWVQLADVERSTLGFDRFGQVGAGIVARPFEALPPLRIGGAWIAGPDLRGWSLGVGLGP